MQSEMQFAVLLDAKQFYMFTLHYFLSINIYAKRIVNPKAQKYHLKQGQIQQEFVTAVEGWGQKGVVKEEEKRRR